MIFSDLIKNICPGKFIATGFCNLIARLAFCIRNLQYGLYQLPFLSGHDKIWMSLVRVVMHLPKEIMSEQTNLWMRYGFWLLSQRRNLFINHVFVCTGNMISTWDTNKIFFVLDDYQVVEHKIKTKLCPVDIAGQHKYW